MGTQRLLTHVSEVLAPQGHALLCSGRPSLRNDPRFGLRLKGPAPKTMLKIVGGCFTLFSLLPVIFESFDPYAAREASSGT